MRKTLSPLQIETLVRLRDDQARSWEMIGKEFDMNGEWARAVYRRQKGAAATAYKNTTPKPKKRTDPNPTQEKTEYEEGDGFINVVCASTRMMTKDDLLKQFNIDLNEWEIASYRVKTSEGYRKDRRVTWNVVNGKVIKGKVRDSGKMLVVPLYHIEVRLTRKKTASVRLAVEEMIAEAEEYAPKYPKIAYPKASDGQLFEIDMQDIHFGRLTWDEESGESYDVKLARKAIESVLVKLLSYAKSHSLEKILIPLGNDFFNVDNKFNTTTGGTLQQEDTRWQKTFRLGREICVRMIETCSQIAPVDVLMIPGNHDEARSFYLGDALYCWFRNNPNVIINNSAAKQKYYEFGRVMLGFAHGYDEDLKKLPFLMAVDQPEMWARTQYREWHTGDKHHKKDLLPKADESTGMVIRIMRSLAALDAWTFNKGYRSLRASEAFVWDPKQGLVAQYTALPEIGE